ncbi:MAG TPA: type II toxin-antitoxin system mRNA interferase toxin, RelE/StbE family [Vicinamibacteria bacterium]|nr:type II toxin-antitoxin system mRNA interferase toxin, RelE/StbE family [Vicinamibacteria bacterium]
MWEVLEHRQASRRLDRLPVEVLTRYEKWKDIVRVSGPRGLRLIKGFHDEALRGEWKWHRSSGLSLQYRVIYGVEAEQLELLLVDVTPHDYRKRG